MGHLRLQLNIIRLRNLDADLPGKLFVRCYVSAGKQRRIRIDTREISPMSEPCWNELTSLECQGDSNEIGELIGSDIVFELRWRSQKLIFSGIAKSKLLGRAEVSWKDIFPSTGTPLEKWITFVPTSPVPVCLKPPTLLVTMEAEVLEAVETKVGRRKELQDCGCRDCKWNRDEDDMFAAAAAATTTLMDTCW